MRRGLLLLIGMPVLALLGCAGILIGSRIIDPGTAWQALTAFDPGDDAQLIVRELRVPRTLLAMLVGAALGAAGAIMQALTRNPLAEPGLLGINAGAGAAAATGIGLGFTVGAFGHVLFAFAGAAIAAVLVAALGGAFGGGTDPVRLTLSGAALSVVLGAYTQALLINYPTVFEDFRFWVVGSLQGRDWELVPAAAAVIIPALLVALLLTRSLNAAALGSDLGRALGADLRRTWIVSAVIVIVLCGAATAAAGPIGFLGLVAPLAARQLAGPDYRWIVPLSMIGAAALLTAADVVARIVTPPAETRTAILMALIGAPVFIAVVRRRRLVRL
ncbi:iron complex transport system permease protein [Schumannella luteola]|uniref:Iron complex transport system permease protein n=1 Tax=Schumannella luteola TaxID=472059 RepID=A0A852YGN6_9MICO|nr:iron complex transport system permease protein [Schumannella luteola]